MTVPGALLTLDVEKPAAGGRMLARDRGQVVLVWGAIPGERVVARVERIGKGVVFADAVEVVTASADRRQVQTDWRCGGHVYAHVHYARQLRLKAEIIGDACSRIGKLRLSTLPEIVGSPEQGYRMRARLHARSGRLGFFREGSRELCDAASTEQFLPTTSAWIAAAQECVREEPGLTSLHIAENVAADERACHLELREGTEISRFARLARIGGLVGLSAQRADRPSVECLEGVAAVTDVVQTRAGDSASALRLRRDVRSFFQGNRFLIEALVRHVVSLATPGPVVDLYAGVGLFGLSAAAAGAAHVTLVEGDPVCAADLGDNAQAFATRVRVERRAVEAYLGSGRLPIGSSEGLGYQPRDAGRPVVKELTCIADPPRTGLSREALAGLVRLCPGRLVYVSCDVATLARDARALLDAGYELAGLTGFDLFPNTAHVESVAVFECSGR